MPQRKTRRENPAPLGGTQTAAELEVRLFGLGQVPLQLDGHRLKVPAPIRNGLGEHYDHPVILSPYAGSRLRIVPQRLWADYRQSIVTGANNQIAADDLRQRLNATCAVCALDSKGRWNMCAQLLTGAGFPKTDNGVVLVPSRFWLELYSRAAWQSYLLETEQRLSDASTAQILSPDRCPKSSQAGPSRPGFAPAYPYTSGSS